MRLKLLSLLALALAAVAGWLCLKDCAGDDRPKPPESCPDCSGPLTPIEFGLPGGNTEFVKEQALPDGSEMSRCRFAGKEFFGGGCGVWDGAPEAICERCAVAWPRSASRPAALREDVSYVQSQELNAGGDEKKRYALVGATPDGKAPEKGWGLVVVLPGASESLEALPFVKRIHKRVLTGRYLMALPKTIKWTPRQSRFAVWPTEGDRDRVPEMRFGTEELVESVIQDISARQTVDPARVFTLSWSSGTYAAVAVAQREPRLVTGSLIVNRYFPEGRNPSPQKDRGLAYYFYREMQPAPHFDLSDEKTLDDLAARGAIVGRLSFVSPTPYSTAEFPAFGWPETVFDDLDASFRWLEEHHAEADPR